MERLHFYGGQAELFLFYQLSKVLFTDPQFRMISAEAKILYGLLLDRMSLSAKNGWLDSDRIRFVLMCLRENTTQVRNMRQYLLASLYNTPITIHSSYAARVQHNLNPKPAKY